MLAAFLRYASSNFVLGFLVNVVVEILILSSGDCIQVGLMYSYFSGTSKASFRIIPGKEFLF